MISLFAWIPVRPEVASGVAAGIGVGRESWGQGLTLIKPQLRSAAGDCCFISHSALARG